MNRFSRESALGGRNVGFRSQQQQLHRRGSGTISGDVGGSREGDESLVLFSKLQHNKNVPLASEKERFGSQFLEERSKIENLFCADSEKSDYDWLLTPPGTPPTLSSSLEVTDRQSSRATPRNNSNSRPPTSARASRFYASQSESSAGGGAMPARSSSTTAWPSISNTYSSSSYVQNCKRTSISNTFTSSSHISNNARTSAVLNTSTASVTSKPSPSIKSSRSSTPVKAQPSAMSPGDTVRIRARPSTISTGDTAKTRPATPTARTRTPCVNQNPNSNLTRSSTLTRRTPPTAPAPSITRSNSVGRCSEVSYNKAGHLLGPCSSPALRSRAPVQALPPPSELRSKPVERAISVGRQRLGNRIQTNSILPEANKPAEKKQQSTAEQRLAKQAASSQESSGFGRTISKKSMDMALKHMDVKHTSASIQEGNSVFPRSIRSAAMKCRCGQVQ